MDAITCGRLALFVGETKLPILGLAIEERMGCHGTLSADVAVEAETKDYLLYEGKGGVSLYALTDKGSQLLFCGILAHIEAVTIGRQCAIRLEAVTADYLMDIDVHKRVFQDMRMTSHELVQKMVEPYPRGRVQCAIPDEPLKQIVVQYQETDWAFLNRFLSFYGSCLYAAMVPGISLQAGLLAEEEEADWGWMPCTALRCAPQRDGGEGMQGQLCYIVEGYSTLGLGKKVRFRGQGLYIGRIERCVSQGLLVSRYYLYFAEGLKVPRYYNPCLSGVSINGAVTAVQRNRVMARLEADASAKPRARYAFPFSTVAASPDGSGWYCMPKQGDRVRIFFPTDDESEGYAITNTQGDSSAGNPDLKEITMPDGKTVGFTENGIQISVGEKKGMVTLEDNGKAEVKTDQSIEVLSPEEISFWSQGTMEVTAGSQIQFVNDAGGSITLAGKRAEIAANNIYLQQIAEVQDV